jgi:hypothetical protein
VYVWKSPDFDPEDIETEEYIQKVIQQYFGSGAQESQIRVLEEEPGEESDDFLNFFD